MHYYKRNLGDYSKKAGKLSMLEHGAYTLLMDACYDRERFPTKSEALEWAWARSDDEVRAVEFVLSRFFQQDEQGHYVQSRIQEVIEKYHQNAEINQRIALEREERKRTTRENGVNDSSTDRGNTVNDSSADRDSNNTNRARSQHEAPPNHKPLTNNHKPIAKEDSLRESKKKFIPPTLDELITEFTGRVSNPDTEATKFLSHYESNGWKVGKNSMKSWKSAVVGWATRSRENESHYRNPAGQPDKIRSALDAVFGPESPPGETLEGDFDRVDEHAPPDEPES